jgi:putative membrane protein
MYLTPNKIKYKKGMLAMKRVLFVIAILAAMSIMTAFNDAAAQTAGTLSKSDKDFVTRAAQDGMAEVALGELATRMASNEEVKQFAQRMVDDHTKANNELKELASKEGITFPNEMSGKQKALQDRLAKLSGADFDREYMRAMVKDHDSAVALFEKQARSGGDPELKAWAEKTLPTLREHQQIARDLASKVGAKASD